jgi:hypothetical protein
MEKKRKIRKKGEIFWQIFETILTSTFYALWMKSNKHSATNNNHKLINTAVLALNR